MYRGYILTDDDLEFLRDLIRFLNPKNVLDPYISEFTPLLKLEGDSFFGCHKIIRQELLEELVSNGVSICELDNLISSLEEFDLIVSFPPLQNPRKTAKDISLEKYQKLLSNNGKMILLYTVNFYHEHYQDYLGEINYFPESIIELNRSSVTGVGLVLAIFGKESSTSVHLSKLGDNTEYNKDVLENVKTHRASKNVFKGTIVKPENLKLINNIILKNDIQKKFSRIKLNESSIGDLSLSIKKVNPKEDYSNISNAILFPLIGTRDVDDNINDVNKITSNIAVIELDSKKVLSSYVKDFLNTSLGVAIRKSIQKGATIPYISLKDIADLMIKVPSLNTQIEMNRIQLSIQRIKLEMDNIQREMWTKLKASNLPKYRRRVKFFDSDDNTWIDGLPFPISSILWNYYSTKENSKKVEHLFHFFEATSEFLTIFILSFYHKNKFFSDTYSQEWLDVKNTDRYWYKKSSFGKWNMLLSKLLKIARTLRSSDKEEDKNLIVEVFKNPFEEFYSVIDKSIIRILNEACDLRNKHKGHGGITSDKQVSELKMKLELLLNKIKPILQDVFTNTVLVSAINGKKTKGVYLNTVLELSGTRVPFSESVLELEDLLDTDEIYIVHVGRSSVTDLLPLIRLNFENHATYFYTSIETSGVRWVSYHYEKEPELYSDFDQQLFSVFEGDQN